MPKPKKAKIKIKKRKLSSLKKVKKQKKESAKFFVALKRNHSFRVKIFKLVKKYFKEVFTDLSYKLKQLINTCPSYYIKYTGYIKYIAVRAKTLFVQFIAKYNNKAKREIILF
ncbi:MAG: hypothetical protein Q7S77_02385, partial [Candidatus Staskawiczbacteria bacterium]|nr:hypothetical protein [Candidatus Staskawiczbacteria bacterium]